MTEARFEIVDINDIFTDDTFNVRDPNYELKIAGLIESIKQDGISDPLEVAERPPNAKQPYFLYAGFKRLEAARAAGVEQIPVLIRPRGWKLAELLKRNMQENVARENLNPMEEARGAKRLLDEGVPEDEVRQSMGWSETMLTQRLNLLDLSDLIRVALSEDRITVQQARTIEDLPEDRHERFIDMAQSLTVSKLKNEVEKELRRIEATQSPEPIELDDSGEDEGVEEIDDNDVKDPSLLAESISVSLSDLSAIAFVDEQEMSRAIVTVKSIDWTSLPMDDLEALESLLASAIEKLDYKGAADQFFSGMSEDEDGSEEE